MSDDEVPSFTSVESLIRARRTSLRIDADRQVDAALIDRLLGAIAWAPNHHRTWPWSVTVLTGKARARLGELVAAFEQRQGSAPDRVEKAARKYLRAPVIVLVGQVANDDPVRLVEDRDTLAAGIQNVLLLATAAGLASHWATGPWLDDADVKSLAGLDTEDRLVALVYLGWPTGTVPTPARPRLAIRTIDR